MPEMIFPFFVWIDYVRTKIYVFILAVVLQKRFSGSFDDIIERTKHVLHEQLLTYCFITIRPKMNVWNHCVMQLDYTRK